MRRHVAVLAAVLLLATACGGDDGEAAPSDPGGVTGFMELCPGFTVADPVELPVGEVIERRDDGADHQPCNSYDVAPPASGSHFDAWQNCGFYTEPLQDQTAVHSLEHGAVWIAYQPDLDPAVLDEIKERMGVERHVLAAPYPGLQNPIVLTAWTRQLAVNDWSDPTVEDFLATYTGERSPTAPEAGVSCEGAIGSPPEQPDDGFEEILRQVLPAPA